MNTNKPTRRISIDERYRQLFWRVVISIASNERTARRDANPFVAVHLNDTIINTIIALSNAVESDDQGKIAQLRASAQTISSEPVDGTVASPKFDIKQSSILLYINESKRVPFWAAMTALGKRTLSIRGRKSPFEAINISALIIGVFLELGDHKISLDEQVTMPFAMKKTLTISIPPEDRGEFWRRLLVIGTRKSARYGGRSLFRGIDRSELVINLIVDLANALSTKNIGPFLALARENQHITLPSSSILEQEMGAVPLVLSVHQRFRSDFWESMTALGERELRRQTDDNPFIGISSSTIITSAVLTVGDIIEYGDWKRFSDLVGIDLSTIPVDVPTDPPGTSSVDAVHDSL